MKNSHKKLKNKVNNKANATKSHKIPVNQVRIIGGQFKRANVTFVDGDGLRPTPDRMRETLFNWLMNDIHDAKVLDAFAGSGVLGFEALSRGADSVIFIESNISQYQQLTNTVENLKLPNDKAIIYHGKAEQIIPQIFKLSKEPYDLIFIDPPYSLNLWQTLFNTLENSGMLKPETHIYVEADKPMNEIFEEETLSKIEIMKEKRMGQVNSWLIHLK